MASLQETPARKILLIGGTGQVGNELLHFLGHLGEVTAPSSADLDLSQPDRIRQALHEIQPHLIINALFTESKKSLAAAMALGVRSCEEKKPDRRV